MKEQIEEALKNATPGPWYAVSTEVFVEHGPIAKLWGEGSKGEFRFDNYANNAQLIANAPTWLTYQASIISQQSAEIEKVRQSLVDSNYIIDRLVSDYPSELWTRSEVDGWRNQGFDQIKDNKAALEVLNDPNPKSNEHAPNTE